ncbi:hypothetical protein HanPSC8_Chr11g0495181 [Helianthus annuus]|nr:hypothetical protein HanPSC8_Chr11g0495181 [Helianthus annuus]
MIRTRSSLSLKKGSPFPMAFIASLSSYTKSISHNNYSLPKGILVFLHLLTKN